MLITNAFVKGTFRNIEIEDGKIIAVTPAKHVDGAVDVKGKRVIPGLIDVHTHGCVGMDTLDGNFAPMCDFLAKNGTTSWLPTTMTMDADTVERVTHLPTEFPGAQILGFHMEGPYISPKYKGAQNEAYIKAPDYEKFKRFSNVKMITVAPEQPGSMDFIRRVTSEGVCVALGHTDCDYDTAVAAIESGADCLTHTFNAMQPLHHRKPGPIGAACEKHIYAQLICDGVHIHKASVLAAYRMFGSDRLTLISDAIRPAGLPVGTESESGGIPVVVRDGAVYLRDAENTLAGSGSTLWHCVCCAVGMGIEFDEAVKMATETPAELLGVNKGKIEVGRDADLLVIDDEMNIEQVIIAGKRYA